MVTPGSGGRRRRRTRIGTSPTSYLDPPQARRQRKAKAAPTRPGPSRVRDRLALPTTPAPPMATAAARARQARQRGRDRARPRARELRLGGRPTPITPRHNTPLPGAVGATREPHSRTWTSRPTGSRPGLRQPATHPLLAAPARRLRAPRRNSGQEVKPSHMRLNSTRRPSTQTRAAPRAPATPKPATPPAKPERPPHPLDKPHSI